MVVFALLVAGDGHAERRRQRGRGVARAERVELRLVAPQEAGDAAVLLDRRQELPAARQDFVRISLVAHVPDEAVARRVEGVVQGDGQLDRAQRSAGVAAHARHGFQNVLADFVGGLLQLFGAQAAQVGGRVDLLQEFHRALILTWRARFYHRLRDPFEEICCFYAALRVNLCPSKGRRRALRPLPRAYVNIRQPGRPRPPRQTNASETLRHMAGRPSRATHCSALRKWPSARATASGPVAPCSPPSKSWAHARRRTSCAPPTSAPRGSSPRRRMWTRSAACRSARAACSSSSTGARRPPTGTSSPSARPCCATSRTSSSGHFGTRAASSRAPRNCSA